MLSRRDSIALTFSASMATLCYQVQGVAAFGVLKERVAKNGIGQLYSGCAANFTANWVGNFPWFATFNFLQRRIPQAKDSKGKLLRNAAIGICASAVSDSVSNSLRVIKTVKQTATADMSYVDCVKGIIAKDGVKGLFGRGLLRLGGGGRHWRQLEQLERERRLTQQQQQVAPRRDGLPRRREPNRLFGSSRFLGPMGSRQPGVSRRFGRGGAGTVPDDDREDRYAGPERAGTERQQRRAVAGGALGKDEQRTAEVAAAIGAAIAAAGTVHRASAGDDLGRGAGGGAVGTLALHEDAAVTVHDGAHDGRAAEARLCRCVPISN